MIIVVCIVVCPSFSLRVCLVPQHVGYFFVTCRSSHFLCRRRSSKRVTKEPIPRGPCSCASMEQPNCVSEALETGVNFICTQASEDGDHSEDAAALIPVWTVVDEVRNSR